MGYELTPVGTKQVNGYQSVYLTIPISKLHSLAKEAGTREIKIKVQASSPGKTEVETSTITGYKIFKADECQDIREMDKKTFKTTTSTTTGGGSIRRNWKLKGSMRIKKTDKDGDTTLDLSGIGFKVKNTTLGKWLKIDNSGNVTGTVSNMKDATELFTSKENGKYYTKEIVNLPEGGYEVYETSIPDNLKEFYKLNTNKAIVTLNGNYYAGHFYYEVNGTVSHVLTAKNKKEFCAFQIKKIDEDSKRALSGIKFKIVRCNSKGEEWWIKVNSSGYFDTTTNLFSDASEFVTNSSGLTPIIRKLPIYEDSTNDVKYKYKIYEVDVGKYDQIYSLGKFTYKSPSTGNTYTYDGKYIERYTYGDEKKRSNSKIQSINGIPVIVETVENTQDLGSAQMIKTTSDGKNLSGVGFKIKANGAGKIGTDGAMVYLNNDSWVKVTGDGVKFVGYDDADVYYTGADGKTTVINNLPIDSFAYSVYEVYIPAAYRDVYGLDVVNYKTTAYDARKRANGVSPLALSSNIVLTKATDDATTATATISPNVNHSVWGRLQVVKYDRLTDSVLKVPGIGFKVRVKNDPRNKSNNDKWVQFNDKKEWIGFVDDSVAFSSNSNTYDTTTIYTDSTGYTDIIRLLPVICTYEIYEVVIPESMQNYYTLDQTNFTPLYRATTAEEALLVSTSNVTLQQGMTKSMLNGRYLAKLTTSKQNNEQSYISLSGNVWEDSYDGKNVKTKDNQIGNNDKKIQNIRVYLQEEISNGIWVNAEFTDVNGNVISSTSTDANGNYSINRVRMDKLEDKKYRIMFSYDGITYEAVDAHVTTNNQTKKVNNLTYKVTSVGGQEVYIPADETSKATETNLRNTINNAFTEVTREGQKILSNTINYDTVEENGTSRVYSKGTVAYNWDRQNNTVKLNQQGQFQVTALINATDLTTYYYRMKNGKQDSFASGISLGKGYEKNKQEPLRIIPNLNLGLFQREQTDLALSKDTYSAQIDINNKTYTYKYAQKMDAQVQSQITDDEAYMRNVPTILGTAFERKNPLSEDLKYKAPVYRADMQYTDPENSEKDLKVSIIYAIGLVNNSVNLHEKVNSIKEYYTEDMDIVGVYSDSDCKTLLAGAKIENQSTYEGTIYNVTESKKYKTVDINLRDVDNTLDPKTTTGGNHVKYIYIKMSVPKTTYYDIESGVFNEENEYRNYAEISSYTTYYKNGNSLNTYAHFDYDSVPNTITTTNSNLRRVEDDSDMAPGLQLQLVDERTISGVVFKDDKLPDNGLNVLIGDGVKADSEKGIEGVTVQLVPIDNTNINISSEKPEGFTAVSSIPKKEDIEQYYIDRNLDVSGVNKLTVKTDNTGKFTIEGYVPGDYQIRFIRSDILGEKLKINGKEIVSLDYKSTVYNSEQTDGTNPKNWYLSDNQQTNYSEAADTWANRLKIDEKLKINYDDLKVNLNTIGKLGDVNGDGEIDISDCLDIYSKNAIQELADGNKDGKIDDDDIDLIQQYIAGWKNGLGKIYSSIPYSSEEEYMLHSWTRPMDLGVELRGVEGNDYVIVEEGGNASYKYNIESIDFGLIERPNQQLVVTKELKKIRIIDGQDRIVVEAEVVEDENGNKILKNADEIKYTVYLAPSDANASGTAKSEMDKDYLPAKLEATYTITIKDEGRQDYGNETFYYYGPKGDYNVWSENPVKIKPCGVYDYLSKEYDLNGEGNTTLTTEEYTTKISEQIDAEKLIGENAESTKTVIEYAYTKEDGTSITGWKSTYKTLASLYEEWNEKVSGIETTRKVKLDGRRIVELNDLEEKVFLAGQIETYTYTATSVITSTSQGISLQNDVEIVDTQRIGEFGKTSIPTYKTLFDSGEDIIVTPPTGENRDKTESNIWIITISSALAILGVGIVLIKKFLKKNN